MSVTGGTTDTVTLLVTLPQVTVYVVDEDGETDTDPAAALLVEKPVPVHDDWFDDHVKSDDEPGVIVAGDAVKVAVGEM